jgi:tetratricopeptide (TPR) repeat protein
VAFTSERQKEIAELEDQLARRSSTDNPASVADRHERLAFLYGEDGKYERAVDQARKAMEADRRPSADLLNLMANWYDALGAPERAEKHYREAMRVAPGSAAPRFNLSLLLERQGGTGDAVDLVEEALRLDPGGAVYRGWRAILWRKQGRKAEATRELDAAADALDQLPSLDEWRRSWRSRFARELGDTATAARLEREAQHAPAPKPSYDEHRLPGVKAALAGRAS